MSKPGPAGKPTALRLLHGDKKARITKGEPVPPAGDVVPPDALDADALAVWNQLAPQLQAQGVLTSWDAHLFGIYCQSVVYAQRAERVVNQTNVILAGRNRSERTDVVVRNPAVAVFRDMSELALRAGARFGLTPSDRASLGTDRRDALPGEHLLTTR